MKCEEVWLYCGVGNDPMKGHVIRNDDYIADGYFVREGLSVNYGWTVSGVEGEVGDEGQVWFHNRVSDVEIKEAYVRWYKKKIEDMQHDIGYYQEQLKALG